MKEIIFGMIISALLFGKGVLNMWLIIQRGGGAGSTESLLSFAPAVSGAFLYLFFASRRKKIIDLNMEYPKRRRLL